MPKDAPKNVRRDAWDQSSFYLQLIVYVTFCSRLFFLQVIMVHTHNLIHITHHEVFMAYYTCMQKSTMRMTGFVFQFQS